MQNFQRHLHPVSLTISQAWKFLVNQASTQGLLGPGLHVVFFTVGAVYAVKLRPSRLATVACGRGQPEFRLWSAEATPARDVKAKHTAPAAGILCGES